MESIFSKNELMYRFIVKKSFSISICFSLFLFLTFKTVCADEKDDTKTCDKIIQFPPAETPKETGEEKRKEPPTKNEKEEPSTASPLDPPTITRLITRPEQIEQKTVMFLLKKLENIKAIISEEKREVGYSEFLSQMMQFFKNDDPVHNVYRKLASFVEEQQNSNDVDVYRRNALSMLTDFNVAIEAIWDFPREEIRSLFKRKLSATSEPSISNTAALSISNTDKEEHSNTGVFINILGANSDPSISNTDTAEHSSDTNTAEQTFERIITEILKIRDHQKSFLQQLTQEHSNPKHKDFLIKAQEAFENFQLFIRVFAFSLRIFSESILPESRIAALNLAVQSPHFSSPSQDEFFYTVLVNQLETSIPKNLIQKYATFIDFLKFLSNKTRNRHTSILKKNEEEFKANSSDIAVARRRLMDETLNEKQKQILLSIRFESALHSSAHETAEYDKIIFSLKETIETLKDLEEQILDEFSASFSLEEFYSALRKNKRIQSLSSAESSADLRNLIWEILSRLDPKPQVSRP